MSKLEAKTHTISKVAQYMVSPGLIQRGQELFSPFRVLPLYLGQIFVMIGLLPMGHYYTNPGQSGRFGVRHVLAAAGLHLRQRQNPALDQTLIYYSIVLSFIVLLALCIILTLSLIMGVAQANPFVTPTPETDLAFSFMDQVFGIPGMFNSEFALTALVFPTPFQSALHSMIGFYNMVALFIGFVVLVYIVITTVGQTAISGQPFGKDFNKVWGIIRIIIAFCLLLPFGVGLNGSQYVVLQAAKLGSSIATNAWIAFNNVMSYPFGTGTTAMVQGPTYSYFDVNGTEFTSTPITYESTGIVPHTPGPVANTLTAALHIFETCKSAYEAVYPANEYASIYNDPTTIKPYIISRDGTSISDLETENQTTLYNNAKAWSKDSFITIVFGQYDPIAYSNYKGSVHPLCGKIRLSLSQAKTNPLLEEGNRIHWDFLVQYLNGSLGLRQYAQEFSRLIIAYEISTEVRNWEIPCSISHSGEGFPQIDGAFYPAFGDCDGNVINANYRQHMTSQIQRYYDLQTDGFIRNLNQNHLNPATGNDMAISQDILDYGWAGAGIWFNRLADLTGETYEALYNMPQVQDYPKVMKDVVKAKLRNQKNVSEADLFRPIVNNLPVEFDSDEQRQIALALSAAHDYWALDIGEDVRDSIQSSNPLLNIMGAIFGIRPLLTVRDSTFVHPLSQLAAIGKGLIHSAIYGLGTAFTSTYAGGALSNIGGAEGKSLSEAGAGVAGFGTAIAFVGLTAGFILFYIVPFLPFLYFFLAVGVWAKSVFEALLGAPLWAIVHLDVNHQDGFVPKTANMGYFLILEIFLRPLLILFSLIATVAVFSSLVAVLNEIFNLVTANLTGFDDIAGSSAINDPTKMAYYRNIVDQFFFLIFYVILMYLIANSCFKMIDQIPAQIMRWVAAGVSSFAASASQAEGIDQIKTIASISGYRFAPQIGEVMTTTGSGLGRASGKAMGVDKLNGMADDVFGKGGDMSQLANRLKGGGD